MVNPYPNLTKKFQRTSKQQVPNQIPVPLNRKPDTPKKKIRKYPPPKNKVPNRKINHVSIVTEYPRHLNRVVGHGESKTY